MVCGRNMRHSLLAPIAGTIDHPLPLDYTWKQWHSTAYHHIGPVIFGVVVIVDGDGNLVDFPVKLSGWK